MKHRGAIPEWVGYPLMAIYISLFAGWNVVAEWATSGIALPAVLILSGVRALTAAALMFIFYLLRTNCSRGTPLCPPLPHLKRIAITGVLRSFTSVFFGIGLSMAGSVNASVFHSIVPGITALVAVMMGYEQLRWRRIGGVATAMVGALIVLGAEELFQGAKRTLGPGVDNDALAYAPKDDLSRSSPQSHAITLTGVSSHDLHFSRAHVGLLMLFGYCTTYTAYYILMHALTRLKPAGSTASATPTARTDEEDNYNASTDDHASDDEEAAGVVAADEVTPPSNAVSAEQHYAADHMMALLQLASGTATMLVLALFAVAGAVSTNVFAIGPLDFNFSPTTFSGFQVKPAPPSH